ncbi:MAG: hypothetical protein MUC57_02335 [Desulfobacterales bacterium]|jgi:hypothetical protein|nr:hypothetical protein [Desulfobacterales bacterium]
MIRILILALLGYVGYRVVKRWARDKLRSGHVDGRMPDRIDDVMIKDPQCGTYFPRRDGVSARHADRDLFFCSRECRDKYLAANSPPAA